MLKLVKIASSKNPIDMLTKLVTIKKLEMCTTCGSSRLKTKGDELTVNYPLVIRGGRTHTRALVFKWEIFGFVNPEELTKEEDRSVLSGISQRIITI